MRVLILHNLYQQPGGEDVVARSEERLLRQHGHEVRLFEADNSEIDSFLTQIRTALEVVYSPRARRRVAQEIAAFKPDVVHVHNFFPLFSPSVYYACREAGVPVVQSLHNPRLLCPAATFHRAGGLCQDCLGRLPWPAVIHRCYHDSTAHTAAVGAMLVAHRALGTWEKLVDSYVVFTEFYKKIFIEGGLPADKITVKPHFAERVPGPRLACGDYALFVGRLAPEKGVVTLLKAWEQLGHIPLKIRGAGQLAGDVADFGRSGDRSIEIVPRLSDPELVALRKGARMLIWPSQGYYETFGMVAIEAFACGLPIVASRTGVMAELVEDGKTGLLFAPGDASDLARKIEWLWSHPRDRDSMGKAARAEYEAKYTPERNYEMMLEIYNRVTNVSARESPEAVAAVV